MRPNWLGLTKRWKLGERLFESDSMNDASAAGSASLRVTSTCNWLPAGSAPIAFEPAGGGSLWAARSLAKVGDPPAVATVEAATAEVQATTHTKRR